MLDSDYYDHIQSLWGAFAQAMGAMRAREGQTAAPPQPILQLRAGYAESPGWFLVQAAEFDPEPLTVQTLRRRDIYASESLVRSLLEVMASEKWFDRYGDEYLLRPEGRAVMATLNTNRLRRLAAIPISEQPARRLHQQFKQLIDAALDSPSPPGTWCLDHSRRRAPTGGSLAAELFQFVADFNAFRDDCHMAAWQRLDVEGYVWEAFAIVGTGTAAEAEAIYDQLAYRGYTVGEYANALRLLRDKGWLSDDGASSVLTPEGETVRAEVERLTDAYFYTPWAKVASAEEYDQIHKDIATLVTQLAEATAAPV